MLTCNILASYKHNHTLFYLQCSNQICFDIPLYCDLYLCDLLLNNGKERGAFRCRYNVCLQSLDL